MIIVNYFIDDKKMGFSKQFLKYFNTLNVTTKILDIYGNKTEKNIAYIKWFL